ncbi:MAG: lytic transglycosylase domain-containing protein [Thiotrichaceae bacterium]
MLKKFFHPFLLFLGFIALLLLSTTVSASNCINADANKILSKAKIYQKQINAAAKKYRIDSHLIRSVIAIESCYKLKAVSTAGAQGLMQLMPDTADRFGVKDSFNASQNIKAGTRYLRFLQLRYKGNLTKVLAAYNAGEGKVDRYQGIPPYKETQTYVKNVLAVYKKLRPPVIAKRKVRGKPGRQGVDELRARAPHLFKKQ